MGGRRRNVDGNRIANVLAYLRLMGLRADNASGNPQRLLDKLRKGLEESARLKSEDSSDDSFAKFLAWDLGVYVAGFLYLEHQLHNVHFEFFNPQAKTGRVTTCFHTSGRNGLLSEDSRTLKAWRTRKPLRRKRSTHSSGSP